MNFFESQALARRNTKILVVLFALAVLAVIVAVDLVLAAVWIHGLSDVPVPPGASFVATLQQVPAQVYLAGAAIVGALILGVSGYQVLRLSAGGGERVASMVGAREVEPGTRDPRERRLLNVVEEMSIASGVRMPAVYVMDGEKGINAFAAGYDISNAVVAVTRGTLEALNRDELQAVIAHEYSHILNGDMRLNIRMMGVLAGIVFIGGIGEFLMRSTRRSRGDGAAVAAAAGIALLVIGYIGLLFARLIKAAASRQREYLADASSVQFTRNPDGIAGALDQIATSAAGTRIENRRAEDMSHMFFGQGIKMWFGGIFDTHPPVAQRIRKAHPDFNAATYRAGRARSLVDASPGKGGGKAGAAPAAASGFAAGRRSADEGHAWGRSAGESVAVVGTVEPDQLAYAQRLIASMPEALYARAHEPDGACAVIVALMLAPSDEVMKRQLDEARAAGAGRLAQAALALAPEARGLGPAYRLPLVDLALPAAKKAGTAAQGELIAGLKAVIQADRRVSLHEYVVLTLVRSQLAPHAGPGAAANLSMKDVEHAALRLLRLVAHAGAHDGAAREAQADAALRAGAAHLGIDVPAQAQAGNFAMDAVDDALRKLKALEPMQKALLVKGLFAAVTHDGTIRVMEAELMRMICAALDCPLPPLLTDVDPATLAA